MEYDLFILVADGDYKQALEGLLSTRCADLGIRNVRYRIEVFSRHDAGCFKEAHEILRAYLGQADKALVVFDHDGSGQEDKSVSEVEENLKRRLSSNGWGDNADVVVVAPEIEVWVWSESRELEACLGWEDNNSSLKAWMEQQGIWPSDSKKPTQPEKAFKKVLRKTRLRLSSSIFRQLSEKVKFERCEDASFRRLRSILKRWFAV